MSSTETDNSQQNNITQSDADTDDVFSSFKTEEDLTRDLVATEERGEAIREACSGYGQGDALLGSQRQVEVASEGRNQGVHSHC